MEKEVNYNDELSGCPFCRVFDFAESKAVITQNGKFAHISSVIGSTSLPVHEQFNYCPVCGRANPNKKNMVQKLEKENNHGKTSKS